MTEVGRSWIEDKENIKSFIIFDSVKSDNECRREEISFYSNQNESLESWLENKSLLKLTYTNEQGNDKTPLSFT